MKRPPPDPALSILVVCLTVGFLFRSTWRTGVPPASWATPPSAALEPEHLLAQEDCLPSRLFRDSRTAQLLPIVSPALTALLAEEAALHPFETRADEELTAMLESVSGIGPKKAARLIPFLCSKERTQRSRSVN